MHFSVGNSDVPRSFTKRRMRVKSRLNSYSNQHHITTCFVSIIAISSLRERFKEPRNPVRLISTQEMLVSEAKGGGVHLSDIPFGFPPEA